MAVSDEDMEKGAVLIESEDSEIKIIEEDE